MERELETGGAPMPRSRPVKRLSDGELAELQLVYLLDRGWIQCPTAGHAAAAVFARRPRADGSVRICYDYRGLNAIRVPCPAVQPITHIYALLDGTRGSRRHAVDLRHARSREQLSPAARAGRGPVENELPAAAGQLKWHAAPFGLPGASPLPMRATNQARADFPGGPTTTPVTAATSADASGPAATAGSGPPRRPTPIHGGVPGA
jgi:hypothetical protein